LANGHGGARPNSGRPSTEFLERAKQIGDPIQILQLYWDVATGKDMEQVVTDAGESIATPAQVKDRLRAGELYLDRVIGKVPQGVELSDPDGDPLFGLPTSLVIELAKALKEGSPGESDPKPREEEAQ
jgi:hypothetical protein